MTPDTFVLFVAQNHEVDEKIEDDYFLYLKTYYFYFINSVFYL